MFWPFKRRPSPSPESDPTVEELLCGLAHELLLARDRFPEDASFCVSINPDEGGVMLFCTLACNAEYSFKFDLDDDVDGGIVFLLERVAEHLAECPNRPLNIGEVEFHAGRDE